MPLGHGPSPEEPMSKAQGSRGKLRFGLGTRGSSRRPVCQNEPEEADDLKDEQLEDIVEHTEDIEEIEISNLFSSSISNDLFNDAETATHNT